MDEEFDIVKFKQHHPRLAMCFGLLGLTWFVLAACVFCYALACALSVIASAFVGV
jgi:hypothetical protein